MLLRRITAATMAMATIAMIMISSQSVVLKPKKPDDEPVVGGAAAILAMAEADPVSLLTSVTFTETE